MASKVPAKSILKQGTAASLPTITDEQKEKAERDRWNLGVALFHANKIQSQKDVQAQILANIEVLLDFPADPVFTSSEASRFARLLQPFQPSDFDNLVEERRADGKCGYALCANSPRSSKLGSNVAWKLKGQGAGDYCSNACLEKALYVKAQLSETPVWERAPIQQPQIILHADDRPSKDTPQVAVEDTAAQRVANDQELAHERGDTKTSLRPRQVMSDTIVEKSNVSHGPATLVIGSVPPHDAIEGYIPAQAGKQARRTTHETASRNGDTSGYQDVGVNRSHVNEDEEAWNDLFNNMDKR